MAGNWILDGFLLCLVLSLLVKLKRHKRLIDHFKRVTSENSRHVAKLGRVAVGFKELVADLSRETGEKTASFESNMDKVLLVLEASRKTEVEREKREKKRIETFGKQLLGVDKVIGHLRRAMEARVSDLERMRQVDTMHAGDTAERFESLNNALKGLDTATSARISKSKQAAAKVNLRHFERIGAGLKAMNAALKKNHQAIKARLSNLEAVRRRVPVHSHNATKESGRRFRALEKRLKVLEGSG